MRAIFTNGETVKSIQNKTSRAPLIPRKSAPERYPIPTSKGDQENQPVTTAEGALQQTVHTISKNKNITINSVDDQEPIDRQNRSSRSIEQVKPTKIIQNKSEPIAQRTRSRTFAQKYTTPSHSRALATQILTHIANSVLEQEIGKKLNYGQLRKHPRFQETWNKSFSNEMGILCQEVGKGLNGKGKIIEGTNTFFVIKFENIPQDRLNKICYTSVVCEVRPDKKEPNRTRIKICGTHVCYTGDVDTNTASLEIFKLMINSVLLRAGDKYVCFDIDFFTSVCHLVDQNM